MAFIVKRMVWRPVAHGLLLALIAIDLISIFVLDPIALIVVRFVHGAIGGALVGLTYSLFARTAAPDRTFGVLLLVQAATGGLGVMILPLLVPRFGTPVLFWALILFTCITLLMLQFLPSYPVRQAKAKVTLHVMSANRRPLLFALLSVTLFQAANMGLYAFLIGLGRNAGLEVEFISQTLGISNWVAMLGALLVIFLSTRHGIFLPIVTGILINILGTWMFLSSESKMFFVVANCLTAVTWNFGIAYLLGMAARFDEHGQTAVWAGFASKIGLASGPMVGALILADTSYGALVWGALGMLVLGVIAASIPAWSLDRRADMACLAGGAK
jgi:DHA1 family inner membrane transport protein